MIQQIKFYIGIKLDFQMLEQIVMVTKLLLVVQTQLQDKVQVQVPHQTLVIQLQLMVRCLVLDIQLQN